MTRDQWEEEWWKVYREIRAKAPHATLSDAVLSAHTIMKKKYGQCPKDDPAPPFWVKLGAVATGVPMDALNKFWTYMNGKKTAVGASITILAYLAGGLPLLAPFVSGVTLAKIVGVFTFVLGLLHKLYKFIYREDHA